MHADKNFIYLKKPFTTEDTEFTEKNQSHNRHSEHSEESSFNNQSKVLDSSLRSEWRNLWDLCIKQTTTAFAWFAFDLKSPAAAPVMI